MDLICLTLAAHTSMLPKSLIFNRICYLPLFTSRLAAAHYTCCTPDNHQTGAMSIGTFKTTQWIKYIMESKSLKKPQNKHKNWPYASFFFLILYMGTYLKGACAVKASCREAVHSALTILEKAIIACQSLASNLQQGVRAVETGRGNIVTVYCLPEICQ